MGEPLFEGRGFTITAVFPAGAAELDAAALVLPDVSRLPGARVVAARGWDGGGASVRAGCAVGPSDRFAPGLEDVLFEKATWFALQGAGAAPSGVRVERSAATDRVFRRTLAGREGDAAVRVDHLLAFDGPDRDAVLCSVVCRGAADRCGAVELALEGESAPAPEPSALVRSIFCAADHPWSAAAALAVVAAAVAALILWRRPYPRP